MERFRAPSIVQAVQLVAMLAALVLAVRHWRTGRGDRRGALRVGLFVTACYWLGGWAVFVPARESWLQLAADSLSSEQLGHALAHGVLLGCFYLAFEPFARRYWPLMLVGWSRLLAGRVRDPLVGREVLFGVAGSALTMLLGVVVTWLLSSAGVDVTADSDWRLGQLGNASALAWTLLVSPPRTVLATLGLVMMLLLLRILLRRNDLAVAVMVALVGAMILGSILGQDMPLGLLAVAVVHVVVAALLLLRVGLLAFTAFVWTGQTMPLALPAVPAGHWLGGSQIIVLATACAVLAWAAWVSMAGRPLLAGLLDEEAES